MLPRRWAKDRAPSMFWVPREMAYEYHGKERILLSAH